jgi:hypothetical protein
MTIGEKVEQLITGRPDSYVPARTLERLLGRKVLTDDRRINLLMHFGQGALLGSVRGVMAAAGLRGAPGSAMFAALRLSNDQILENATGVGAPPWTWPRQELVIDVLHKAVYALATGMIADRLIRGRRIDPT